MPGFANNVVFANNVDFSGGVPTNETGTITTDGQLLIGTTAANPGGTHINVGNFVSTNNGTVTTGYTSPNITLKVSDILSNTIIGNTAGNGSISGNINTALGVGALSALTSGTKNSGLGFETMFALTTGSANVAVGHESLWSLISGSKNIAIGDSAGSQLDGAESYNIYIGNTGDSGESNTIRIGTPFAGGLFQRFCYIAGIDGVNVGSVAKVVTENSDQLGTATIAGSGGVTVTPTANTITIGLSGGGTAATSFDVQANTAPGTDPVVPTALGVVTVNGAVVANHSVVLETRSRAANAYNLEVQYAASAAATDGTKSGVAHFSSAAFAVDASGFVTLAGGGTAAQSFVVDAGTSPVVPNASGQLSLLGTANQITTTGSLNTITLSVPSAFIAPGSIKSTTTVEVGAGNLIVDAGNVTLPNTNSAGTQGLVIFGTTKMLSNFGTTNAFGGGAGNLTLTTGSATNETGFGVSALAGLTTGNQNTAFGNGALQACANGTLNVAVGLNAGNALTSSSQCTFVGNRAGKSVTSSGGNNTAVGSTALTNLASGFSNCAFGQSAGSAYTGGEQNNICIGDSVTGTLGESNAIRIGSGSTTCFIAGIDGVNVGSVAKVVTEASNQLGTATITAGTGITITPGANLITINATGGGLTWTVITGASQAMTSNNGYIANRAGTVAFTLPTSSAVGDIIEVTGINTATGWSIAWTTNQQVFFGNATTTVTTGSLASTAIRDSVRMVCVVANLTWNVLSSVGNITCV